MKKFKDVLKQVAANNHTTPENVLKEMQLAIDEAFSNPDPQVQAQWSQIPHKGEKPTAEEVVNYITLSLISSGNMAS